MQPRAVYASEAECNKVPVEGLHFSRAVTAQSLATPTRAAGVSQHVFVHQ